MKKLSPESLISVYSVNTQLEILNSKISKMTMDRYSKWLVSQKYIIKNHDVDEMLSNVGMNNEYTIFEEKDRISGNQRILLEIEKSKFNQRKVQADEERMTLRKVTNRVAVSVEKKLTEKMIKSPINKLIWGFPDFGHYSSFAYSASLNFSKLGSMTTLSKPLSSNILELANNSHFCSLLGRTVKPTNDPKAAIGYIGIENCRRLFPLLMAKPLLRLSDKNTSIMTPKIWQHSVLTANTARIRLEQSGYKEPDEGIFLGVIRTLSYYVLSNYFTQVFEDVQLDIMIDYRKKKLMKEYYACFNVKPTLNVLPNLMLKLEKMIAQRIVENIAWDPKVKHLRKALVEDIQEKPVSERSLHGVALAQARAFSIYNMMDKSNVFVEKHTPYWFSHVRMDMNTVSLIEQEKPQKLSIA